MKKLLTAGAIIAASFAANAQNTTQPGKTEKLDPLAEFILVTSVAVIGSKIVKFGLDMADAVFNPQSQAPKPTKGGYDSW